MADAADASVGSQVSVQSGDRARRSISRSARIAVLALAGMSMVLTTNVGEAAALTPNQTTISGVVTYLNADLNSFWYTTFRSAGWTYTAPTRYYWFDGAGLPTGYNTACGLIDTSIGPAYCHLNHEIYLDKNLLDGWVRQGDYRGGVTLAHEWGHHIQWLRGHLTWALSKSFYAGKELQADCYAGVYTRSLANRGYLAAGDFTEGQTLLSQIGDKAGTSAYSQSAHGTGAQRAYWFKQGYDSYSLVKCDSVYTWLYG